MRHDHACFVAFALHSLHNALVLRIGRRLKPARLHSELPDWQQANPRFIERATEAAMARTAGGWVVVAPSRDITPRPKKVVVDGHDLVAWRAEDGSVHVAPNACPHMGAELCEGRVEGAAIVCPWHGLALGPGPRGAWKPKATHDDGVLVWAQLRVAGPHAEEPTERPILAPRPKHFVAAVIEMEARCEPEDVVANRLDPWHGVHYHPHSFAKLDALEVSEEAITLRVAYRVTGPLCVEVDCTFHAPTRRSIVMTIVGGDGTGSVVETHATPIADGRTLVTEATLATSDRPGFHLARHAGRLLRPFIEKRASRLWVEDVAYAERRYELRTARTHLDVTK